MTVSTPPRRLLSIGHSYGVALNRALPSAIGRVSGWEVTVAAPRFFQGHLADLRPVALEVATAMHKFADDVAVRAAAVREDIEDLWAEARARIRRPGPEPEPAPSGPPAQSTATA